MSRACRVQAHIRARVLRAAAVVVVLLPTLLPPSPALVMSCTYSFTFFGVICGSTETVTPRQTFDFGKGSTHAQPALCRTKNSGWRWRPRIHHLDAALAREGLPAVAFILHPNQRKNAYLVFVSIVKRSRYLFSSSIFYTPAAKHSL